jgi:predicted RNase H-like HicB family nuclease
MLQDYKNQSWHIHDMGLFTELARTLSKYVGRITYTSPWQNAFPSSKDVEVGEGAAKFERIDDIHEVIDETDLFIFPDVYFGKTQIYLRNAGKKVFGSFDGDELEIYREDAKEHFKQLKIPQGPYEVVKGINALRQYIKAHDGEILWVKIEKTRGDTESFKVESYETIENKLDGLKSDLGPKADIMKFIVEKNLKGTIDIAIDTHCIDGQYPSVAILGTEEKGELYVGVRKNWNEIYPPLVDIYTKLSPTLKEYGYCNFISLESRKDEENIYLGDPCQRGGSPPMELELEWIQNLPDIFSYGADGKMIDPEIPTKYGIELIIHSDWADKHPLMVDYPEKLRDKIKFRYDSTFNGKTWIMPQGAGPRIAAVVTHGNSLEKLFDEVKEIAGQIKGIQIESFTRSIPIIQENIKQLEKWGIKF